jgi:hypothetical protein
MKGVWRLMIELQPRDPKTISLYRLRIGAGGMGLVYMASSGASGRKVAPY